MLVHGGAAAIDKLAGRNISRGIAMMRYYDGSLRPRRKSVRRVAKDAKDAEEGVRRVAKAAEDAKE
jgi:hypothetical protein